jgi:hypothetical protein
VARTVVVGTGTPSAICPAARNSRRGTRPSPRPTASPLPPPRDVCRRTLKEQATVLGWGRLFLADDTVTTHQLQRPAPGRRRWPARFTPVGALSR